MGNKIGKLHLPRRARGSKKLQEEDAEGATPGALELAIGQTAPKTQGGGNEGGNITVEEGDVDKSNKKKKKKEKKSKKKEKKKAKNKKNKSGEEEEEAVEERAHIEEEGAISQEDHQGNYLQKDKKNKKSKKDKRAKEAKSKKEKKKKKESSTKKSKNKKSTTGENCEPTEDKATPNNDKTLPEEKSANIPEKDSSPSKMRGQENIRPSSPKGAAVMALVEKFGGASPPGRPVSYPAARTPDVQTPVYKKPNAYSRFDDTPQKKPDNSVNALKQRFHSNKPESPAPTSSPSATPAAAAKTSPVRTPSKYGGKVNKWSPNKQYSSLKGTDSNSDDDVKQTPSSLWTTTTATTTTTTGISALRNKFNNNKEDKTNEQTNWEKKRKVSETDKRSDEMVKKENEKNRSPRKFWSPKKQATPTTTPSRDASPNLDASSRKRKSSHMPIFGSKGKVKTEAKHEPEHSIVTLRKNHDQNSSAGSDNDEDKAWARRVIQNRTSALIAGIPTTPATPKTPAPTTTTTTSVASIPQSTTIARAPVTNTPSRVQFEEMVPKRTKRDVTPKMRPKTEYDIKRTPSPRPKSVADTRQMYASSPASSPAVGFTNPNSKKQQLLRWCQMNTQGYQGVNVTNFSSSWADGLAFCALVHNFYPTAFNFNSLSGSNRADNFNLAFQSAQKFANVSPLLDTADMIEMGDKPDWKCVFTYITSLYAGLTR